MVMMVPWHVEEYSHARVCSPRQSPSAARSVPIASAVGLDNIAHHAPLFYKRKAWCPTDHVVRFVIPADPTTPSVCRLRSVSGIHPVISLSSSRCFRAPPTGRSVSIPVAPLNASAAIVVLVQNYHVNGFQPHGLAALLCGETIRLLVGPKASRPAFSHLSLPCGNGDWRPQEGPGRS